MPGAQPFGGSDQGRRPGPDALVTLGFRVFNQAFFAKESQRLDSEISILRRTAIEEGRYQETDAYVFKEFRWLLGNEGLRTLGGASLTPVYETGYAFRPPAPPGSMLQRGSLIDYTYSAPYAIHPPREFGEFLQRYPR